ncbi:hypothetical protein NHF46_04200 [Arthrobacter alpinus]|nr:hypothetical protein [Arthrobacter alpinus]
METQREPEAGCTLEFPIRLTIKTNNVEEIPYLDQIFVCSDEASGTIKLTNYSDQVWAFSNSSSTTWITSATQSLAIGAFHSGFKNEYDGPFMVPGESVSAATGTDTLEWAIHPALSVAWTAQEFLLDTVKEKGTEALRTAMTEGSASRQAVWDCTVAVYDAGKIAQNHLKTTTYEPDQQIKDGWGLASDTGSCVDSWDNAFKKSGETKIPAWSQFSDDALKALDPAAELGQKSANLKNAVWKTASRICTILPKGC